MAYVLSAQVLYERQTANLVASWRAYAAGSPGASVQEEDGVTVCLFPTPPEREIYNNALLDRDLDPERSERAVAAMERAYDGAGIRRYAAWVHEADAVTITALTRRGYRLDTATRAMAMVLDDLVVPRPVIDLGDADWAAYRRMLGVMDIPEDLLRGVDPQAFRVRIARLDGRDVAAALAYDHDGDCGIYNVGTVPEARRRGLGTGLTAVALNEARDRGCVTASLQSTAMAERVYASVGFRDLGRFLEFVP